MPHVDICKMILEFDRALPHFPDGRINYTDALAAPVLTVFVLAQEQVLLLRRSMKVATYRGKWNTVAGYLDRVEPLIEKVRGELREELGLRPRRSQIRLGEPFAYTDASIARAWYIAPAVALYSRRPPIELDWEHTRAVWVSPGRLDAYDIVPGLDETLRRTIKKLL